MAAPLSPFSLPTLLLLFLLFFFAEGAGPAPAPSGGGAAADAAALLALRSAIDPDRGLAFRGPGPCRWPGVRCSPLAGEWRVTHLVLEGLRLRGPFPGSILARLAQLRLLSLKNNSLSGPVGDLSSLSDLKALFLSRNRLSGPFPLSLLRLHRLRSLDLSHNAFSGPIPPLNQSSLAALDLSGNAFSGPVPATAPLLRAGPAAFAGNPGLCGRVVARPCHGPASFVPSPAPAPSPATNTPAGLALQPGSRRRHRIAAAVGVAAGAVLVIGAAAVCGALARRRRGRRFRPVKLSSPRAAGLNKGKTQSTDGGQGLLFDSGGEGELEERKTMAAPGRGRGLVFCAGEAAAFTVEELMRAAADMMGKGTVGSTYKAVVAEDLTVSVKRVDQGRLSLAGKEAFELQMEAVGRLRHPNLVPLRAFLQANEERLLVFDYQPNGSLFSLIHGSKSARSTAFHWTSCLKITEDVAQGLACFHQTSGLVHGGVKSSNVLLGNDFEARLVDGGLAQLIEPSGDGSGTALAYRAPELLGRGSKVTAKADIYAFGVLILELLAGRPPPQVLPGSPEGLAAWVRSGRDDSAAEDERVMMLIGVAIACVRSSPEGRPTAWQVLKMLQEVKEADADDEADVSMDNGEGSAQ
ncbi:putative inactive receptor kinase At5g67200 [Wolffia australiana]